MAQLSRRRFVQSTAAAALPVPGFPAIVRAQAPIALRRSSSMRARLWADCGKQGASTAFPFAAIGSARA